MSTSVNIHNKDHVTIKLLIDMTLEMCVGGRLLSWEFTLRGGEGGGGHLLAFPS